ERAAARAPRRRPPHARHGPTVAPCGPRDGYPPRPVTPRVRGRYMKTFLEEVDRLPPSDAAAIRERIGAAGGQAIETAGFLSWLPVASNLDATRAVTEVLGPKRSHTFFVELGTASYRTPLMQGLVRAVAATAGHDPARFLAWTQKAMTILFADMGTW